MRKSSGFSRRENGKTVYISGYRKRPSHSGTTNFVGDFGNPQPIP
jgi:hypothetical protein